jgi:hypothetical protein
MAQLPVLALTEEGLQSKVRVKTVTTLPQMGDGDRHSFIYLVKARDAVEHLQPQSLLNLI